MPQVQTKFLGKKVRNPARLWESLKGGGLNVDGVGCMGSDLYVTHPDTEDPSTEVNAYVQPDYYEFTGDKPQSAGSLGPKFSIGADGA